MDDTSSDPGTFVSCENFMMSAGPSPDPLTGGVDGQPNDEFNLDPDEYVPGGVLPGDAASSVPPDRASFMWSMFNNSNGEGGSDDGRADEGEDSPELNRGHSAGNDDASDEDHSYSDASDLCVEIDEAIPQGSASPSHSASVPVTEALRTPHHFTDNATDRNTRLAGNSLPDISQDRSPDQEHETATLLFSDESPPVNPAEEQGFPGSGPGTATAFGDRVGLDDSDGGMDLGGSDDGTPSPRDRQQLFQAASGMTSFQVENPFYVPRSEGDAVPALTLFSKNGPFSNDEKSALDLMALSSTPEAQAIAKLVETIEFQREQMTNFKDTAAELAGNALHEESRRFSEIQKRRSLAMNALIHELDAERARLSKLEERNRELTERLSETEKQREDILSYCKQIDVNFSFSGGVEPAFESIFANLKESRRHSAQQVAVQNRQLEDFASRVMALDQLLADQRKRFENVEAENTELKLQLSALEGASKESIQDSPEVAQKTPPQLDAITRERDNISAQLEEERYQLETVREVMVKTTAEKKKVDDAILKMNVDLEMARNKINMLQKQRDTAERECREVDRQRTADRKTYHEMSQDLSENIVAAVNDIDQKDSEIRLLRKEVEDRESVVQALQKTVSELEEQLGNMTNAAIQRTQSSKLPHGQDGGEVSTIVDTVMKNLRLEISKSQSLLTERSNELNELKKRMVRQDEVTFALRRECDRYRTIAAVKEGTVTRFGDQVVLQEQQNSFLRRLSASLGIHSANNHEMIDKLISRLEQFMQERSVYETGAAKLRSEVLDRERRLHVVRSEMQAEISTLRAENQHIENVKKRANEERQFAEEKLLEVLGQRDFTKSDSFGDVTSSSFASRRQSALGEGEGNSRRESFFSVFEAENSIQWNDPLVAAAIQSLNDLIEMKEGLAARLRAMRERFDRMIKRAGGTDESGNDVRALMIESRELQEDLSGVVDLQHGIIDKLRTHRLPGVSIPGAEDSLPYIRGSSLVDEAQSEPNLIEALAAKEAGDTTMESVSGLRHNISGDGGLISIENLGEAAGFLREQLKQTRHLYNEKSKANAQLCGVVAELRHELQHLVEEKRGTEELLSQVAENQQSFVSRLSEITGTDKSTVAIEDFVQVAVNDVSRLSAAISVQERRSVSLQRDAANLVAQKHILAYMIGTYQSKYQLDLLMSTPEESESGKRRFRICVHAVVAGLRLGKSSRQSLGTVQELDISAYMVPGLAPIGRKSGNGITLIDASVALSAIPRLESALLEREKEISDLRAGISALENAIPSVMPEDVRNSIRTSFAYEQDVMNRKEELGRKLRKALREKADIELQYSHEKEVRIAAEAKLVRYSEKLATAKKRLSKASAHADSKERTYKAAIKYLKHKADKALENDINMDENRDPWANHEYPAKTQEVYDSEQARLQVTNAKSLTILEQQIVRAETDLRGAKEGSAEYEELKKYIHGLHKAVRRLKQPKTSNPQGPSQMNSNVVA